MEQSKKHLKITSVVALIFAGLSLFNLLAELVWGDISAFPEGISANTVLIAKIILAVITFMFILPQIYIGFKGLKMAKNPDSSKAHIVWAVILFIFGFFGLISSIIDVVNKASSLNISGMLTTVLELIIYFDYIKFSREVSKSAK